MLLAGGGYLMPRSPKRAKGEQPAATDPGPRSLFKAFRHVKASEIERNPKNWRVHPTFQREALKGVLQEHGFAGAVLCYEPEPGKLRLIDGEARLDSLPPDYEVPVIVIDADEKTADALLATWDPLSAMARPDQDKLLELLASVETESQAVKDMLEALANGETQPLPDEVLVDVEPRIDEADALRKKWGVERGQVWTLGQHLLMCGDATSKKDHVALIGNGKIDLVLTDPPYGVGIGYESFDD